MRRQGRREEIKVDSEVVYDLSLSAPNGFIHMSDEGKNFQVRGLREESESALFFRFRVQISGRRTTASPQGGVSSKEALGEGLAFCRAEWSDENGF